MGFIVIGLVLILIAFASLEKADNALVFPLTALGGILVICLGAIFARLGRIAEALERKSPPPPHWWDKTFFGLLEGGEKGAKETPVKRPPKSDA